jgi:hypothetical protein
MRGKAVSSLLSVFCGVTERVAGPIAASRSACRGLKIQKVEVDTLRDNSVDYRSTRVSLFHTKGKVLRILRTQLEQTHARLTVTPLFSRARHALKHP